MIANAVTRQVAHRTWARLALMAATALMSAVMSGHVTGQGVLIDESGPGFRLPRPIEPPIWPPRPRPMPRPPVERTYRIKTLAVEATLDDAVAKVQTTQTFVNTGSATMEVRFVFPLPEDGAIDRLTYLVDGEEFEAKLMDKDEARTIYEGYVRKMQDPALLEWMGNGLFRTSVFPVPPGAERTVSIRYSQVLKRSGGLTELLFPLATARYSDKPVERTTFRVVVNAASPIKSVYSPSHEIKTTRTGDRQATVTYEAKDKTPDADFRLFYDTGREGVGVSVMSYKSKSDEEGYFLMLLSPDLPKPDQDQQTKTRKAVVLVIDRSGSMSGKKIEQARDAVKFFVNNLRDGDLFNLVVYDSDVELFRPELQKANDETRQQALGFAEGIYAGGSTNIDGALKTALGLLKDESLPSYVLFLTDGMPTTGETGEMPIVKNAAQANDVRARILTMGIGFDVNSRLLNRLSGENFGATEYVRPNEDIEAQVAKLYGRIANPVLVDVDLTISRRGETASDGPAVNRVLPGTIRDIFAGDATVIVGRYRRPGEVTIRLTGKTGETAQTFTFEGKLADASGGEGQAFIAKLWASRRIGEILDQIDLKGKNDELVKELVALSKQHGILTPYTSFLADDQPEMPGTRPMPLARGNAARFGTPMGGGGQFGGSAGGLGMEGFDSRLGGSMEGLAAGTGGYGTAPAAPASAATSGPASLAGLADAESSTEASRRLSSLDAASGQDSYEKRALKSQLQMAQQTPSGSNAAGSAAANGSGAGLGGAVRTIGEKTFFLRTGVWVDQTATAKQIDAAKTVKRFSDEYFALITAHGDSAAKILAQDGELLVVWDDTAYRITD